LGGRRFGSGVSQGRGVLGAVSTDLGIETERENGDLSVRILRRTRVLGPRVSGS
jgi:hypothetical protein